MVWARRTAVAVVFITVVGATVAEAGCGSGGTTAPNPDHPNGPVRAKMLVDGFSFAPGSVEWPQNGGWEANSHTGARTETVIVTVGGDARSVPHGGKIYKPTDGWLDIEGSEAFDKSVKPIDLHGIGAIRLTKAPTGKGLPRSALKADLEFTSQSGITGTIHLKDGTVTLNR